METDSLHRQLLSKDEEVDIYTPSVPETTAAIRSLNIFDEVTSDDVPERPAPDTTTFPPDVHTLEGIITHAREAVNRLSDRIDYGVCLVFLPSHKAAETAIDIYPFAVARGEPHYYVYPRTSSSLKKLRRPCFVFGGPEMDACEAEDVSHVIDSCRIYRRHSMVDWSLSYIGRARWMSRRHRAWVTYEPLADPSHVLPHEFTTIPDLWDVLLENSPNIVTAAILFELLSSCPDQSDLLIDHFHRHKPSHKSIAAVLRQHGHRDTFSTTRVDWDTASSILTTILPSYDALSHDVAIINNGTSRARANGMAPGTTGVYTRVYGTKVCGRIVTGMSSKPILTRRIDTRGVCGIAALKYRIDDLPAKISFFRKGHAVLVCFDESVVETFRNRLHTLRAEEGLRHTLSFHINPTITVRLEAGLAFKGIMSTIDSYAATAFFARLTTQVGRLLTTERGWFIDDETFQFVDRDAYIDLIDTMAANNISSRAAVFHKTGSISLRRVYDVDVTWYDGASTLRASVDGRDVEVDDDTLDEYDIAIQHGVDADKVRLGRIVRRISRTIPGTRDAVIIKRCYNTCVCRTKLTVHSDTRLASLRNAIPRFDTTVNQPIRATVNLRMEGSGYGNLEFEKTKIASWSLWDDFTEDPFERLAHVHPTSHTTYVVRGTKPASPRIAPSAGECLICCDTSAPLHPLAVCGCETFCIHCLQTYVNTCLEEFRECLVCPATTCGTRLHVSDVLAFAHPDVMKRYLETLGSVLATRFKDLLTRCPGGCGEFARASEDSFTCETCATEWCLICSRRFKIARPAHTGFCGSFDKSEWGELKTQASQAGLVSCPSCETPYDKDNKCMHVSCLAPRCLTHFCWGCGVAFSNAPNCPDAQAVVLSIEENGVAVVDVIKNTWLPSGGIVPVPRKGTAVLDASRMTYVKDNVVWYPVYIYEHMTVCSKRKD